MILAFGVAFGQQPVDLPKPNLTGTVTDASGALIPGAKVSLFRNAESVPIAVTTTDRNGKFEISLREKGVFKVVAEATCFKPTTVEGIAGKRDDGTQLPPIILQVSQECPEVLLYQDPAPVMPVPSEISESLDPPASEPIKATLCDVVKEPGRFNGKIVELRATIRTSFEVSLLVDNTCGAQIWFTVDTIQMGIGKSPQPNGPAVRRKQDEAFRKMQKYLNKQPKDGRSSCIHCPWYQVTVTAIGRFDHIVRDPTVPNFKWQGFGHLNFYESQLVLQSVKDVEAKRIDPSLYEKKQ